MSRGGPRAVPAVVIVTNPMIATVCSRRRIARSIAVHLHGYRIWDGSVYEVSSNRELRTLGADRPAGEEDELAWVVLQA